MEDSFSASNILIKGGLIVAGVINLLPTSGVLGPIALQRLYGIEFAETNLIMLMKHRASLLGIVGALLCTSAFKPAFRSAAYGVGFSSMLSYMWLAVFDGFSTLNKPIRRVFWFDAAAVAVLGLAFAQDKLKLIK
eukprot:TRINITY_DN10555_c0_g1_i1.p2 TRINITY_DN10555_c0_g1~~TRINITY_DN10555_c0_g1_i1.p2  ORF type:complete len:135 (+),score=21.71 TRINITY_DN10555_c0_g1_i1:109-513(+)